MQGEETFHVQQLWQASDEESLYGLGQRQEGKLDVKGYDFDLWQRNTVVHVPMFVSSRGYGVLWDNTVAVEDSATSVRSSRFPRRTWLTCRSKRADSVGRDRSSRR